MLNASAFVGELLRCSDSSISWASPNVTALLQGVEISNTTFQTIIGIIDLALAQSGYSQSDINAINALLEPYRNLVVCSTSSGAILMEEPETWVDQGHSSNAITLVIQELMFIGILLYV